MNVEKKLIFVTGGVLSSLGKGIVASSVGALLEDRGISTTIIKADPYLNVDSGTMSPYQHGEVFVTDDGAETDLDLGYYERFLNRKMSRENHLTSGKVLFSVITRERRGDYLGGTVQVIPHVTDEIKRQLTAISGPEVIIVEIGGTVGDIESQPFLEAVRQLRYEYKHTLCIHVTLVPFIGPSGEIKTKPTQHSVKELRSVGLTPDLIICRTVAPIPEDQKRKIALFANIDSDSIVENPDLNSIYQVPLVFNQQDILSKILPKLGIFNAKPASLHDWFKINETLSNPQDQINIAMVGKYSELSDAYKSINEALLHAGLTHHVKVKIHSVPAEELEKNPDDVEKHMKGFHGVLIPGGFGHRGIEGKMLAARACRKSKIPYFGICLGMQLAVIDMVREIVGNSLPTSEEFDPKSEHKVFWLMRHWIDESGQEQERTDQSDLGGSMRLGAQSCKLKIDSKVAKIYQKEVIQERHRHRFELNPLYIPIIEKHGLKVVGYCTTQDLAEIVELDDHPWFIGSQFHPEFNSRPMQAHPLFVDFIRAAIQRKSQFEGQA